MSRPPAADAELALLISDAHVALGVPAVGAGAVYCDGATWSVAVGRAVVAANLQCVPTTPFRIGSVTKTFTATAALLLVEEGALALDEPAVERLPELGALRTNGHPLAGVTLRRLLTHRSGLVSDPPSRDWYARRFPPIEQLLATLDQGELAIAPGTQRKYSNFGYALVGELIARAAGMPCTAFIEQRLLTPLGLEATCFRTTDPSVATGYVGRPGERRPLPRTAQPDLGGEAPAGQLSSTVPDLLRWLAFQLGHLTSPALPSTVLERLHRPTGVTDDLVAGWSLGWALVRDGESVVHLHGGGVDGFTCAIAFDRAARTGAALLTNGEVAPEPTALRLLDAARRLGPPPAPIVDRRDATPPDRALIGSYDGVLSQLLHVTECAGVLHVSGGLVDHAPGAELEAVGADVYRVAQGRFAGELLTAHRDADGAVVRLTLGTWRYERAST